MFQSGFPDVYAMRQDKGQRWIEVKNPKSFAFTTAQKLWYPRMLKCGIGIWVLMGDGDDQLALLDGRPNLEAVMLAKNMGR